MALMPVAEALATVLADIAPLPEEMVALEAAHGRVLARDLTALRTQPPAAMSAMDGYAVRAADVTTVPTRLTVIGEVAAGRPFDRALREGEAARIFTGGVVPDGADAIIIQEDTTREGDVVVIGEPARPGRHIRPAGTDFRADDVLLRKGRRLTGRDLALAAAMNHPALPVHRRPKVALLATGDELVAPGGDPGPGQIVCSNGYALRAMAEGEGAEVIDLGMVGDRLEETRAAIRRARDGGANMLVTTGGASVGDHDMVQAALKAEGVEIAFWKVAIRPGKPVMNGRLGAMRVLGLPGNPVSSYICGFLFGVPLIRALSGRTEPLATETAILAVELPANDSRQDYMRATLTNGPDGLPVATPVGSQDSSLLRSLSNAGALIVRPPQAPAAAAGSRCVILKLPL
ncbi:MAG: molybdopterin molybdenumtransferase MoeA [Xanthobacteraceae bacterium]|nr:MAG: molybdopterin molybdenumtransferase MoeA [Xanthobacteraceae bacterium]